MASSSQERSAETLTKHTRATEQECERETRSETDTHRGGTRKTEREIRAETCRAGMRKRDLLRDTQRGHEKEGE